MNVMKFAYLEMDFRLFLFFLTVQNLFQFSNQITRQILPSFLFFFTSLFQFLKENFGEFSIL